MGEIHVNLSVFLHEGPWVRAGLDHVSYVINIGTSIPKSTLFSFENYLVSFDDFWNCKAALEYCSGYYANVA